MDRVIPSVKASTGGLSSNELRRGPKKDCTLASAASESDATSWLGAGPSQTHTASAVGEEAQSTSGSSTPAWRDDFVSRLRNECKAPLGRADVQALTLEEIACRECTS